MTSNTPPVKIGEILTQCGLITQEQLDEALRHSQSKGIRLGEALIELGILDEDRLTWALGLHFDLSYVDVQPEMVDWSLLLECPMTRLFELHLVPLTRVGNEVTVVTSDPSRPGLTDFIANLFPRDRVVVQLSSEEAIHNVLLEADRRRTDGDGIDLTQTAGYSARPQEILAALDGGIAKRLYIVKTPESLYGRLLGENRAFVGKNTLSPNAMAIIGETLGREFASVMPLPGGEIAIRPADDEEGHAALRAVSVTGPSGWITALERIDELPPEVTAPAVVVLASANPAAAKAAALRALAEASLGESSLALSIEARVDFLAPGTFQLEIPGTESRLRAAAALLGAIAPDLCVLELEEPAHLHAARALAVWPRRALIIPLRSGSCPQQALPPGFTRLELPNGGTEALETLHKLLREVPQ